MQASKSATYHKTPEKVREFYISENLFAILSSMSQNLWSRNNDLLCFFQGMSKIEIML